MEFGWIIAKRNLTLECYFYLQQPTRMLTDSLNSSSAFDGISIRIYGACENEPQTVGKCGECFKI